MDSYYRVLGVSRSANEAEIKAAFRKKALEHHPDRHVTHSPAVKAANAAAFKTIKDAFEALTKGTPPSQSDRTGRPGYGAGPKAGGYGSSSSQAYNQYYYTQSSRSSYTYQQPIYNRFGFWTFFRMLSRNMTSADGYFHLLMAGGAFVAFMVAASTGDSLWERHNEGKLFKDIERRQVPEQRHASAARAAAAAARSGAAGEWLKPAAAPHKRRSASAPGGAAPGSALQQSVPAGLPAVSADLATGQQEPVPHDAAAQTLDGSQQTGTTRMTQGDAEGRAISSGQASIKAPASVANPLEDTAPTIGPSEVHMAAQELPNKSSAAVVHGVSPDSLQHVRQRQLKHGTAVVDSVAPMVANGRPGQLGGACTVSAGNPAG